MLRFPSLLSSFRPLMDVYMPGHGLWPQVRPLLRQTYLLEKVMDELQQQFLKDMESVPTSTTTRPVSYQLERKGENFDLSLDTAGFAPEELSVKQVGRRVIVSGKMEKKEEDGKGSYSYRYQQFRQEFPLPEDTNPEDISCHLDPEGRLHIQAAQAPRVEEAERELTIQRSSKQNAQQSVSGVTQGSGNTKTDSGETDQTERKE